MCLIISIISLVAGIIISGYSYRLGERCDTCKAMFIFFIGLILIIASGIVIVSTNTSWFH